MQKNLFNWLALLRTDNIGPVKFKQYLIEDPVLSSLPEIANKTVNKYKHLIEQDLAWASKDNCSIMLLSDHDYPEKLRKIHAAPPVLFIKGNKHLLSKPQIAIVGSRNASYMGQKTAFTFASHLANLGLTITSGLAMGIDTSGHRGALSVDNGSTIAILGQGIDSIYPKQNTQLADRIISKGGAIISELPTGVMPLAANFPRRNRIISGLSLGVVVIEASIKSGSLITAKYALEQNREVFAVPGSIYDQNVRGCHRMIQQGAKLVENVEEIVQDLGFRTNTLSKHQDDSLVEEGNKINNLCNLDKLQEKILTSIAYSLTSVDFIINNSGLDAGFVAAELVNLEFSGYITALPGGYARLL
jgi:DNA processing protein